MDNKKRFEEYLNHFNKPENQAMYDFLFERFDVDMPSSAFSIIRYEIRKSLIFENFQASITLTNHYMEKFLKVALINSEVNVMMTDTEKFTEQRERGIKLYNKRNLWDNIVAAKELGIINEAEKAGLKHFKDMFRNTFSHFDHQRLIVEGETTLHQYSLDGEGGEISKSTMKNNVLYFDLGLFDYEFAKGNARNYFIAIDDIAMRYEFKTSPEMIELIKADGHDIDRIFNQFMFERYL